MESFYAVYVNLFICLGAFVYFAFKFHLHWYKSYELHVCILLKPI